MSTTSEAWIWYENPVTQTVLGWLGGDLSLSAVVYMYAVAAVLGVFLIIAFNYRNPLIPLLLGGLVTSIVGLMPVMVRIFVETAAALTYPEGATAAPPAEEMVGHTRASIAVSWLLLVLGFWLFAVAITAWMVAARSWRLAKSAHPHVMVSAPTGQGKQRALQMIRQLDEHQTDPDVRHGGDSR